MEDINSLMINYKNNYGLVRSFFINIYELAFKIKDWALTNEMPIESSTDNYSHNNKGWSGIGFYYPDEGFDGEYLHNIYAETEVEAIIKAGEWILENKKKVKRR
jgi:hypothetical protein